MIDHFFLFLMENAKVDFSVHVSTYLCEAVGLLLTLKSWCPQVPVCLGALSPVDTCCLPVFFTS